MANMLVPDFIKDHKPTFPVGFAARDSVLTYLGISITERFVVPQIVLIDKRGVIRLQSPPLGDANLQDEKFLRAKIEELLGGGAEIRKPSVSVKSAPPAAVASGDRKPTTTK
jgi:hypothetical protein